MTSSDNKPDSSNSPPSGGFIPLDETPEEQPSAEPPDTPSPAGPKQISRRRFLKYTGLIAGTAAAGAALDAFVIEPHWFEVTQPTISIANLPPAWDGVRIAHITDIHIGRNSSLDHARQIVDMCNDLKPDIIALTGDYVSRADAITDALVEVLRDLRAKIGKFAVLGNHDYWTNAHRVVASLESAGIPMLTNTHRILSRNGEKLCIAGVDDLFSQNTDASKALSGVDPKLCRIMLCHNPDYAEMLPTQPRVDLMLSGHTHGGQVQLPLIGPLILPIEHKKYAQGLVDGPRCPVFISRGLGMVSFPVRFNCRPELPLITLRRA